MICPETGKRCLTEAEARDQAAALRRKAFLPSSRGTHAYRCPHWKTHANVGHYHLGRRTKRSRR